jgi:branched-chain amino acid transport system substrate-binding protein
VRRARAVVLIAVAAGALALAGCGSKHSDGGRIRGDVLTIYTSVPLHGASSVSARAVVAGERLALERIGSRMGRYEIAFRQLDDSTLQRDAWDPGQTTINARLAAKDPTTIGYLGDFNSGASAVAIPVLNRAGIPQISPTSAAVGLTTSHPGASPGEPAKYYPTGIRTYARVVPSDAVQAAVQVKLQRDADCQKTFVADDGEVDGEEMATSFQLAARSAGLDVAGIQSFERNATDYTAFAASVAQTGADCVLISAITESGAAAVTRALAAALPSARIFGTSGLAESSFTDPRQGGIPIDLDSRVLLTAPAPGVSAPPSLSRSFYADYTRSYGDPQPDAIYGYEAMSLLLQAISRATHDGHLTARRSQVLGELFDTHDRRSVLGTYSIDPSGDISIRHYGVYRIGAGRLEFWKDVDG